MKDSTSQLPLVTIGLMIYNEEKFIEETILSILRQKYANYEILIHDNASEDATEKIIQKCISKNNNIKYVRHEKNIGALQNFNSLIRATKSKYFVLAGGHDLWSDEYITEQVNALESNPNAVIAYAPTVWIDKNKNKIDKKSGFVDTAGFNTIIRFNLTMWNNQHAMYGMYRVEAIKKTRLQLEVFGSGAILLAELSLLGSFVIVPNSIWYRRANRNPETKEDRIKRYLNILFSKKKFRPLPHWAVLFPHITAILRSKEKISIKCLLLLSLPSLFIIYRHVLLYDFVRPFILIFNRQKK